MPRQVRYQCSPTRMYYKQEVTPKLILITLDCFEVSIDGALTSHHRDLAHHLINSNNPNVSSGQNWLEGLTEDKKKFVPYNGGVTDHQKQWLRDTLDVAKSKNQRAIVFCHAPLNNKCCRPSAVCWDAEELCDILNNTGVTLAVFSGHDHDGGYFLDTTTATTLNNGSRSGCLRHIVPPAPLEAPEGSPCYGILHVKTHPESGDVENVRFAWRGEYPRVLRLSCEAGADKLTEEERHERAFWDGCWWF